MKKLLIFVSLSIAILCTGCSGDKELIRENDKLIIDLPPGEKFVNFSSDRLYHYVIHRKRRVNEDKEDYQIDRVSYGSKTTDIILIREH